jgi:hypothetical protein
MFICVTLQTIQTLRRIGLQRELIGLRFVEIFWNYKHILQVSQDGAWVDSGEFPPSLGSFATIPKTKCGQSLDHTHYLYLDVVHVDNFFGDCVTIGGV